MARDKIVYVWLEARIINARKGRIIPGVNVFDSEEDPQPIPRKKLHRFEISGEEVQKTADVLKHTSPGSLQEFEPSDLAELVAAGHQEAREAMLAHYGV